MSPKLAFKIKAGSWRDSSQVCVYSDRERHLGHVVRSGDGWIAFDGTHTSAFGNTFRPLGFFQSEEAAKEAVQSATTQTSFGQRVI